MAGNRSWALAANALVLVAARTTDDTGRPRPWALFDTGQLSNVHTWFNVALLAAAAAAYVALGYVARSLRRPAWRGY